MGKINYSLGKMDPNWAKCLNSGQDFSRSGQKKIIHFDMIFTTATKAGQATTPGHFDLLRHEENLGERYSLYVCCTSGSVGMIISVDVITVPEILLHQERLFVPYVQVERTRV